MIKYRAKPSCFSWDRDIIAVECERETASSVFINGRRNAKRSTYENYYDTWEDAHSALLLAAERRVANYRSELDKTEAALEEIQSMTKPGGAV